MGMLQTMIILVKFFTNSMLFKAKEICIVIFNAFQDLENKRLQFTAFQSSAWNLVHVHTVLQTVPRHRMCRIAYGTVH